MKSRRIKKTLDGRQFIFKYEIDRVEGRITVHILHNDFAVSNYNKTFYNYTNIYLYTSCTEDYAYYANERDAVKRIKYFYKSKIFKDRSNTRKDGIERYMLSINEPSAKDFQ